MKEKKIIYTFVYRRKFLPNIQKFSVKAIGGKSGGSWDPSSQKKNWKSDFAENCSGSGCRVKKCDKEKEKNKG